MFSSIADKLIPSLKIIAKNDYLQAEKSNVNHDVSVLFQEELSIEQVVEEISKLSNPQIILWYVGCYGLRKTGSHFYRDNLISPVLAKNSNTKFWLVDLTAWCAFKNSNSTIDKSHKCCDVIENFLNDKIKCIRSSKIFKKIQEISDKDIVDYFKKALRRRFIRRSSKKFPTSNIKIKDIFHTVSPLIEQWQNYDANHAYSIFQYLEGCFIVDEICTHCLPSDPKIQIVFALPNDELKYYKDKKDSFFSDIKFLISKQSACLKKINLHIRFLSFKYGTSSQERPYNAQGETLKGTNLTYEDIVGQMTKQT